MSARVFLIRHGETDWTMGSKHSSSTEVALSKQGEAQTEVTRESFVGEGKLIDPRNVSRIYCSPRNQARRTTELLRLGIHFHQHYFERGMDRTETTSMPQATGEMAQSAIQVTPALAEWEYGEYEGLTLGDVARVREEQELSSRKWNIWLDGCPGGESPEQVSDRIDGLIAEIRAAMEGTAASWPGGQVVAHAAGEPRDIVCIGHGHILAAMALRWIGQPLRHAARLLIEPAGVAVLGFEHDDLKEPAILLGRRPGR